MAIDYKDHDKVLQELKKAQGTEEDMRENSREAINFVHKRDGQWEPDIIQKMRGKPRYTDDRVNPVIDQICGELSNAEFTLRVRPAGGQASKKVARLFDGLVRNIRNISGAEQTFIHAARGAVEGGADGWEVTQDYVDGDAFDQDLFISPIYNYVDRVWIDPSSLRQDNSDARWGVILEYITPDEYEEKFSDGKMQSIGSDRVSDVYYHKPDFITIAKCYYRVPKEIEIVEMSDGSVYEVDEKFESVQDEMLAAGITEVRRRTRETSRFYVRFFDGGGWLNEAEETVFDLLPICSVYGNYRVIEGKRTYRGAVDKLMDIQRVHNYAFSQNVTEIVLSPRGKYWATREQIQGNEKPMSRMNTSMDPVVPYNHIPSQPPPFFQGGAPVNPGIQTLIDMTDRGISQAAGLFQANLGDNPGLQSGIAIEKQIDRGNIGTSKWFDAMEVAINYTGKVLINAIPRVYDSTRQVRILQQDGSFELVDINKTIFDEQTRRTVTLNDLAAGDYDVVTDIGPAYKSQQEEAAEQFAKIAQIDPATMELGRDVWFKNLTAPGFDDVAARARAIAIQNGTIPMDQMTDEEIQQVQAAAQQEQAPDPNMVLAEAEMMKAQADMLAQQNKQAELQLKASDLQAKYQSQSEKLQSETALNLAKVEQGQQSINLKAQEQEFKQMMDMQKQMLEQARAAVDSLNKDAQTLKTLREAMGADAIINGKAVKAYDEVAGMVEDKAED